MVIKRGRFGVFLACKGYPDCKTTRRLVEGTRMARAADQPLDEKCPDCGAQLLKRHGRFGEFIGCSAYPKCKYIRSKTLGIACPKCGTGELAERFARKGRRVFYGCNRYPECDFTTPQPADRRAVPEVRRAVHRGKAQQERRVPRLHPGRAAIGRWPCTEEAAPVPVETGART